MVCRRVVLPLCWARVVVVVVDGHPTQQWDGFRLDGAWFVLAWFGTRDFGLGTPLVGSCSRRSSLAICWRSNAAGVLGSVDASRLGVRVVIVGDPTQRGPGLRVDGLWWAVQTLRGSPHRHWDEEWSAVGEGDRNKRKPRQDFRRTSVS